MFPRSWLCGGAIFLTLTVVGLAAPAEQYRGPSAALPKGTAPPSLDGPIGTARLESPAGRIEGLDRWEFWWELNRSRYLARSLERQAPAADAMALLTPEPAPSSRVGGDEVRLRIVPALVLALGSPDPIARQRAAVGLGYSGEPAALGDLLKLLARGTAGDRRAASLGLGLLGRPEGVAVLERISGMAGVLPEERAYALAGIALAGRGADSRGLGRALLATLGHRGRGVEEIQQAGAFALGALGDRASVPLLAALTMDRGNRPDGLRAAALHALARIGDPAALPALIVALGDHRAGLRRAAAGALAALPNPQALPALGLALAGDPDPMVRGLSAIALAMIGGEEVGPLLRAQLGGSTPFCVRGYAALALGILGGEAAAEDLRSLLEPREDASLSAAAAVGLGIMGSRRSLPALRGIAFDERRDAELRGYAVLALAMIGDRTLTPAVGDLARRAGPAGLRRGATLALGLLPGLPTDRAVLGSLFEEVDPRVRGAAVASLAFTPREGVLEALLTVAGERGFGEDARRDAIAALGVLARQGRPSRIEELLAFAPFRSFGGVLSGLAASF